MNLLKMREEQMIKQSIRHCPICSHESCAVLHSQAFSLPEGHPLSSGYDIVICEACGFVYADTSIKQEDYDIFYSKDSKYESVTTSTGAGVTAWDKNRLQQTASQIANVFLGKSARILDIGCANGGLLRALKEIGFNNLVGLDPSQACVAYTSQTVGIQAHVGSLMSLGEDLGNFDLVILSHVLEHVQDLNKAIIQMKNILKQNGLIYIEVPDANRYQEYNFSPFQEFNTEHINHFSLMSLINLFSRNGFAPSHTGHRIIYTSPDMPYPVVQSFFKFINNYEPLKQDEFLQISILKYINDSQLLTNKIDKRIAAINNEYSSIMVWGTGQLTMKLLCDTSLKRSKILSFIDANPTNQGRKLNGIPIIKPSEINNPDIPILISSILQEKSIIATINQMKICNKLLSLDRQTDEE